MKQITVIVITAVCIFATFGATYVIMNAAKNQEILNLRGQYESDISNLSENISSLQSEFDNLTNELSVSIAEIREHPDDYINKTVIIKGRVLPLNQQSGGQIITDYKGHIAAIYAADLNTHPTYDIQYYFTGTVKSTGYMENKTQLSFEIFAWY